MPNGEFVGQIPIPDVELDVPGVPKEATSFGALIETTVDFFTGLFGGGRTAFEEQVAAQFVTEFEAINQQLISLAITGERALSPVERARVPFTDAQIRQLRIEGNRDPATGAVLPVSTITGRVPIPLPEQGGPPLITERFETLPSTERIQDMPVDVPLLAGFQSLLPAVRGVVQPSIQGVLGGFTGGLLQEFLRAPQEMGVGQVPMRQATQQVTGCPPEKPHTRILRFIKQNTGVSIKLSRAKALIRELGLENAARCLGVSAGEVCSLLIVASPRRRRGISASDIRIVKRTARRFETLKHDLGHLGSRTGHIHHRRRATKHAHK